MVRVGGWNVGVFGYFNFLEQSESGKNFAKFRLGKIYEKFQFRRCEYVKTSMPGLKNLKFRC